VCVTGGGSVAQSSAKGTIALGGWVPDGESGRETSSMSAWMTQPSIQVLSSYDPYVRNA
jgi:hypothetical protein